MHIRKHVKLTRKLLKYKDSEAHIREQMVRTIKLLKRVESKYNVV